MNKLYVSDEPIVIDGPLKWIKRIERKKSGFIITFNNEDNMHKAARVLMNSGYQTVHKIGGIFW